MVFHNHVEGGGSLSSGWSENQGYISFREIIREEHKAARAEPEAAVVEHCTALSTRGASCVVTGLRAKIALSERAVLEGGVCLITLVVGYLYPRATRALRH